MNGSRPLQPPPTIGRVVPTLESPYVDSSFLAPHCLQCMTVYTGLYLTRGHTNPFSLWHDTTRATSQHFGGCQMRSSTVMDHTNIPACALYRHIGTVIVRLKMEVSTMLCWSRDVCPASGCPESMHRPSGCEQCARTRLNSKCCDCDSVHVDKSRPYRSSTARSSKQSLLILHIFSVFRLLSFNYVLSQIKLLSFLNI